MEAVFAAGNARSESEIATPQSYRPLEGKLALVTGASRGIGAAISYNLASKGASLILNYTSPSSTQSIHSLAENLTDRFRTQCYIIQADLGTPTGPVHLIDTARSTLESSDIGRFQLDILINNAGVSKHLPLQDCNAEEFDWHYRINVLGPLLLIKAASPYLPSDRSGRIVNISSISSSLGLHGQSIYGGTKAALDAMTRTWARELAERATVNSVNPGPVNTDMWSVTSTEFKEQMRPWVQHTPGSSIRPGIDDETVADGGKILGGRPAYTEEVAGVVGMLCTADSAWCTGQVVCANGGMIMAM
ncbi:MAG: hypothetical protein M1818_002476 [Claussenomyces sp. TS43310]|nr:MAG: hypothetical protein M1818_002476 [Claussenomyces sp. TS43310]